MGLEAAAQGADLAIFPGRKWRCSGRSVCGMGPGYASHTRTLHTIIGTKMKCMNWLPFLLW